MKQTAVEWLVEELPHLEADLLKGIIEKAKEMQKQQIIDVYRDGRSDQQSERPSKFYNRNAEQYYNETYKNK
jgi:hypothetical protein